jgi:hypothetical protein
MSFSAAGKNFSSYFYQVLEKGKDPCLKAPTISLSFSGLKPTAPSGIFDGLKQQEMSASCELNRTIWDLALSMCLASQPL